jgi:glycosyltransferase involved in cell wall biosynthesis
MNILLSVVMTNYNHANFLKKRISSILSQLPENAELVIVDDASTDDSVEIIKHFKKVDTRVLLIKNKKNLGVVPSANIALNLAKGKYIALLAADDKILPGFINKTLQVLLDHPNIAICCSDCGLSFDGFPDKNPNEIETTKLLETSETLHIFTTKNLFKIFRTTNFWIPGHTSIIKKSSIVRQGLLNEQLEYLCDWFMIHSIALEEGVAYIPKTLSVWRQHKKTYSAEIQADSKRIKNIYRKLFTILSEEKNRDLRSKFRKATILHLYVKQLILELIWQPKQWDIVAFVVAKVLYRRLRRYLRLEKNSLS